MAELNLGRTLAYNDGSQDSILRGIKAATQSYKYSGKVDASAINQILDAITETYSANVQYNLELTSKNNDTLVDKIKSVIIELCNIIDTKLSDIDIHINTQISNILNYIAKLEHEQNKAVEDLKTLIETTFKNTTEPNNTDNKKTDDQQIEKTAVIYTNLSESILCLQNNIEQIIKSNFEQISSLLTDTIGKINLNNITEQISDKITTKITKVLTISSTVKNKDSKKKISTSHTDKTLKKLSKTLNQIDSVINAVNVKLSSFADTLVNTLIKSGKRLVNSLMVHILTWLFGSVFLIGMFFALLIPFIADPLMKILQPIMDFVSNLIDKVLTFLEPIRDFLLKTLQKIIDNIIIPLGKLFLEVLKSIFENVLKPFFEGIGTVARALGKALGKLIIGIANFFVDVLLPFLRDKLLPVLGSILDVLKVFFIAIKPWIQPLVDIIFSILKTLLEGIKAIVPILVDVIVVLVKGLATCIKTFVDVLTDAFLLVMRVFKIILKPFEIVILGIEKIYDGIAWLCDLDNISGVISTATSWIKDSFETSKQWISEKYNAVSDAVSKKYNEISGAVSKKYAEISAAAVDKYKRAEEWIGKKYQDLKPVVINSGKWVFEKIKSIFGKVKEVYGKVKDGIVNFGKGIAGWVKGKLNSQNTDIAQIKQETVDVSTSDNEMPMIDSESSKKIVDEMKSQSDSILKYLYDFSNAVNVNFSELFKKLDENPNIVPIPMPTSGINFATQENY